MFSSIESCFAPSLLSEKSQNAHKESYSGSTPYRHAVVDGLMDQELLKKAREEIIEELRFAEKETDIYKVNQTGDLANLDGLPTEEAKRLNHLLKVRNAIYSKEFRNWLQAVTGCGPLSEKKKDMSINDYTRGCHLLNHDDVISTRRLSYILYLPDPTKEWKPEWGGALELYPVKEKNEPAEVPSKVIPPKWNQYTFFAVQPGHSFHSVEEVAHPTASRLSISGWFHRPQEDEDGYDAQDEIREENDRKELSSLESLSSKKAALPFIPYPTSLEPPFPGSKLSTLDKKFLSFFLNPAYLTEKTQSILFEKFGEDSHSLLSDVLKKEIAEVLEKGLRSQDSKDGFKFWEESGKEEELKIQNHQSGVSKLEKENLEWKINGPPHRQRYLILQDLEGDNATIPNEILEKNPTLPTSIPTDSNELLKLIKNSLFPSPAFRNWLANLTQLIPMSLRKPEVRRFRPGLDYTLARSDDEVILDVTLGLTPKVWKDSSKSSSTDSKPKGLSGKNKKPKTTSNGDSSSGLTKKLKKDLESKWENGEIGGWECYMAPHEGEEDPAVYQSAAARKSEQDGKVENEDQEMKDGEQDEDEEDDDEEDEEEEDDEDEDDEDFDGVLLNLTPDFNVLNIALRDEGVMRFVKYLSASAGGSRWDVSGEFTCGSLEEESETEEK